jgi:hypothetical protein
MRLALLIKTHRSASIGLKPMDLRNFESFWCQS